jgi:hypothetical protein
VFPVYNLCDVFPVYDLCDVFPVYNLCDVFPVYNLCDVFPVYNFPKREVFYHWCWLHKKLFVTLKKSRMEQKYL